MRGYTVLFTLVLISLTSSRARADEGSPEKAALHSKLGKIAFAEGDFGECVLQFQKSNKAQEAPNNFFNIGLCYERLEQFGDALTAFMSYLRGAPEGDRAAEARTRIELLELKLETSTPVTGSVAPSENTSGAGPAGPASGAGGASPYSPKSDVRLVIQGNFVDHALSNGFGFTALAGWEVINGYVGVRPGARLDVVLLKGDSDDDDTMFHVGLDLRVSAHLTPYIVPYVAGGMGFSSLNDNGATESGAGFQVSGGLEIPLFERYAVGVAASKHLGAVETLSYGLALSRN